MDFLWVSVQLRPTVHTHISFLIFDHGTGFAVGHSSQRQLLPTTCVNRSGASPNLTRGRVGPFAEERSGLLAVAAVLVSSSSIMYVVSRFSHKSSSNNMTSGGHKDQGLSSLV